MASFNILGDLERAFAPLACRIRHCPGGHVGLRLVNGAGQETREYQIALSSIRNAIDLEAEVDRILTSVEVHGFSWCRTAQGHGTMRVDPPAGGLMGSVRQAFRRLTQAA